MKRSRAILAFGYMLVASGAFGQSAVFPGATTVVTPHATIVTAPASAPVTTPTSPPKIIEKVLKDGTQVEEDEDGKVTFLNVDGTRTPAPDGLHTLSNGDSFTVKDGKKTHYSE